MRIPWAASLPLLCLAACSGGESPAPVLHIPAGVVCQWARVTHITDGDTIRVDIEGGPSDVSVRYIGMDTPELASHDAFADAATRRNRELVAGRRICLERDVSETDRYGRILRDIWLADGTLVNEALVREGLAVLLTIPPDVKYAERLAAAQQEARAVEAGLWAP